MRIDVEVKKEVYHVYFYHGLYRHVKPITKNLLSHALQLPCI